MFKDLKCKICITKQQYIAFSINFLFAGWSSPPRTDIKVVFSINCDLELFSLYWIKIEKLYLQHLILQVFIRIFERLMSRMASKVWIKFSLSIIYRSRWSSNHTKDVSKIWKYAMPCDGSMSTLILSVRSINSGLSMRSTENLFNTCRPCIIIAGILWAIVV